MFFDSLYLLFALPAFLISIIASGLVKYWSSKYLDVPTLKQINGLDTVQKLSPTYNLNIRIEQVGGNLSDHYDPRDKTLRLSRDVALRPTITSVAIAAHELGHARQHSEKNILLALRSLIVPTVNLGTQLGYVLIVVGLLIASTNLAWVGIILFSLSTVFSLLTLPIELDASRKGLGMIKKERLLEPSEIPGAQKVLTAAALTYVAATISSLSNLLYFIFRVQGVGSKKD